MKPNCTVDQQRLGWVAVISFLLLMAWPAEVGAWVPGEDRPAGERAVHLYTVGTEVRTWQEAKADAWLFIHEPGFPYPAWQSADLSAPITYFDLRGLPSAYLFEFSSEGEYLGFLAMSATTKAVMHFTKALPPHHYLPAARARAQEALGVLSGKETLLCFGPMRYYVSFTGPVATERWLLPLQAGTIDAVDPVPLDQAEKLQQDADVYNSSKLQQLDRSAYPDNSTLEAREKLLAPVEAYEWTRGCGPTTQAMLLNYWGTHGWPSLRHAPSYYTWDGPMAEYNPRWGAKELIDHFADYYGFPQSGGSGMDYSAFVTDLDDAYEHVAGAHGVNLFADHYPFVSYEMYVQEIDAGRPVHVHWEDWPFYEPGYEGHSTFGFGYWDSDTQDMLVVYDTYDFDGANPMEHYVDYPLSLQYVVVRVGGIQDVRGEGLVVGQNGPVQVDVLAPLDGQYKVRVWDANGWSAPQWDWSWTESGVATLSAGQENTYTFYVTPDTVSESFEFWLYRKDAWGLFQLVDKVEQPLAALATPPDITPPAVIARSHTTAPSTDITITFSEDMNAATFTASTVTVYGSSSGSHTSTLSFDHGNYRLTINPDTDFTYGETAYVTLGTGVTDLAGNGLAGPYHFSFAVDEHPGYTISGNIHDMGGVNIAGVWVSAGSRGAYTNSGGYFEIAGLPQGQYSVTPTKAGYTFTPSNTSVELTSNRIVNFVGTVYQSGDTFTFLATEDTYLQQSEPDTAHNQSCLRAGKELYGGTYQNVVGLLKFADLSTRPELQGKTVYDAALKLFLEDSDGPDTRLRLWAIGRSAGIWSESSTYSGFPYAGWDWYDSYGSMRGSANFDVDESDEGSWLTIRGTSPASVEDYVQGILQGDEPNYGLLIDAYYSNDDSDPCFSSSEGTNPPQLWFQILTGTPDLVVSSISTSPAPGAGNTFNVGQAIRIDYTVFNNGPGGADSSRAAVYLGTTPSDLSHKLDDNSTSQLLAGDDDDDYASYAFTGDDLGTRYLIVRADDESDVSETVETNNTSWIGPFQIVQPNQPPSISGLPDRTLDEDGVLEDTIDLWAYAGDPESPASSLIFSIGNSPAAGAGVRIDGNRAVDIDPATNWCGATEVEIRVADPQGLSATDTFRVTVNCLNDTPWISPPVPDQSADIGTAISLDLSAHEHDVEDAGVALDWTVTGAEHCTVSGEAADTDLLTFTPAPDFEGSDIVMLHLVDSGGQQAAQDVTLTWTRPNTPPVLAWTGEPGYELDGLAPESGYPDAGFVYRVRYTDADGDNPQFVQVHVLREGVPIPGSPFAMSHAAGNSSDGAIYAYTLSSLEPGNAYTYSFEARDGRGANAAPPSPLDAPDVYGIRHDPVAVVPVSSAVPITATVIAPASPVTVTLRYRLAGQVAFVEAEMQLTGREVYSATIPADAVTLTGLEYLIQATGGGFTGTHPLSGAHHINVYPFAVDFEELGNGPVSNPLMVRGIAFALADPSGQLSITQNGLDGSKALSWVSYASCAAGYEIRLPDLATGARFDINGIGLLKITATQEGRLIYFDASIAVPATVTIDRIAPFDTLRLMVGIDCGESRYFSLDNFSYFSYPGHSLYVATAGDDGNNCLSAAAPCQTIQAAIDKAIGRDTVRVDAGIYREHILMKDGVDLVGAGAESTIIDGGGTGHVICADGVRASISGFSITGSGDATEFCGSAGARASAVFVGHGSDIVLDRCRVFGNYDGVRGWNGKLMMLNNLVYDNAGIGVVGMSLTDLVLVNNTLADNRSAGLIHSADNGTLVATNNILDGNGAPVTLEAPTIPHTVTYNLNNDGWSGITPDQTNLVGDPGFLDCGSGDFRLSIDSAAVDAGNPTDCLPNDLEGVARPLDGDGDGNTVCDIGALEAAAYTPIPFCRAVTEIPPRECEALASVYNSTEGQNWTNHTGWMQTTTPCSWYGVTCDGSHVTWLNLSDNGLRGPVPSGLANMPNLFYLDLAFNALEGPILPALGNLTELAYLHLSGNRLSGPIPPELGRLSRLKSLALAYNALTGSIPSQIGSLVNLEALYLQKNALRGDVPDTITRLTDLTSIDLGFNALMASDPAVVAFLNEKDPDWAATQTVAPSNVHVSRVANDRIELAWARIAFTTQPGYYEVSYATVPGGPYTVHGRTADKLASNYVVDRLAPGTTYYLVVRTCTLAHDWQLSNVWSDYSPELSASSVDRAFYVYLPIMLR